MANGKSQERSADGDAEITLELLNAIESGRDLTQRSLANDLGIALGLANTYLKRCVRKGFIKVSQIPPNRYAYYLTPQGFTEKSRLTAEYLSSGFTFFREARSQCEEGFAWCAARGWTRIALAGTSELAEIATLCTGDTNAVLVGMIEPAAKAREFAGLPVVSEFEFLDDVDAVLITDLRHPQAVYEKLKGEISPDRIVTPKLLRVSRDKPVEAGA